MLKIKIHWGKLDKICQIKTIMYKIRQKKFF